MNFYVEEKHNFRNGNSEKVIASSGKISHYSDVANIVNLAVALSNEGNALLKKKGYTLKLQKTFKIDWDSATVVIVGYNISKGVKIEEVIYNIFVK